MDIVEGGGGAAPLQGNFHEYILYIWRDFNFSVRRTIKPRNQNIYRLLETYLNGGEGGKCAFREGREGGVRWWGVHEVRGGGVRLLNWFLDISPKVYGMLRCWCQAQGRCWMVLRNKEVLQPNSCKNQKKNNSTGCSVFMSFKDFHPSIVSIFASRYVW